MKPLEIPSSSASAGKRLGEVLVDMELISNEQVTQAIERGVQKRMRLGEVLVSEGLITPTDLAKALATQFNVDYIDLQHFVPPKEASKILPEKIARNFLLLPIEAKDGNLTLATIDPIQMVKLDHLKKMVPGKIILKVGTKEQIEKGLDQIYDSDHSVEKIVKHLSKKQPTPKTDQNLISKVSLDTKNPASIENLVNIFIEKAILEKASDIHIDPADEGVRVRIRTDGVLHKIFDYPQDLHPAVVSRLKVLSQLDITEKRNPQDGYFNFSVKNRIVDIRVATLPTVRGEKVVMRLLDKEKMQGTLTQIGMSPEIAEQVSALLQRPYGMILITGPTGSGKTTTLYSMLNQINAQEQNIITIEDPVEYKFDAINQVQVNEKAGLTFSGILGNILRQDPDVIMIGEMRDQETCELAIRAALTGHLVLSTLHTNEASSAPSRLIDMGIEPFLITSAVVAVLAQRLVRVLCVHCRKKATITKEEIDLLGSATLIPGNQVYAPVGCAHCMNTGFKNRVAIYELMLMDDELRHAIVEKKPTGEVTEILKKGGFINMRLDGIYKIAAGITSVDEVLKATL